MKRVLLIATLLFTIHSYGQLEVSEPIKTTTLFKVAPSLRLIKFERDTTLISYTLYYQNEKYNHIRDSKYIIFSDSLELNQYL